VQQKEHSLPMINNSNFKSSQNVDRWEKAKENNNIPSAFQTKRKNNDLE
jgi:hypothetical protein